MVKVLALLVAFLAVGCGDIGTTRYEAPAAAPACACPCHDDEDGGCCDDGACPDGCDCPCCHEGGADGHDDHDGGDTGGGCDGGSCPGPGEAA